MAAASPPRRREAKRRPVLQPLEIAGRPLHEHRPAVSGEGLLQTFRGTGEVWVAPTMAVYENLRLGGLHAASGTDGNNAAKASAAGNAANGIASLVRAFAE